MTQTMYDYTCMGVFEKHKLLFSFQMTSMILDGDNDLDKKEFDFYMKGNPSLDRPKEPSPHSWLSETGWKAGGFVAELFSLKRPRHTGPAASKDLRRQHQRHLRGGEPT